MATFLGEEFCPHDTKGFVIFEDGRLRCDGCHTPMVCIPERLLHELRRTPSEAERELRRQNERLRGVLTAIQRSIEVIARTPVPK